VRSARGQPLLQPDLNPDFVVATYRDRRINRNNIPLLHQQLTSLMAELSDLVLGDRSALFQLLDGSRGPRKSALLSFP
jgi:hypothetical protein